MCRRPTGMPRELNPPKNPQSPHPKKFPKIPKVLIPKNPQKVSFSILQSSNCLFFAVCRALRRFRFPAHPKIHSNTQSPLKCPKTADKKTQIQLFHSPTGFVSNLLLVSTFTTSPPSFPLSQIFVPKFCEPNFFCPFPNFYHFSGKWPPFLLLFLLLFCTSERQE
jgi:hypothetical protein